MRIINSSQNGQIFSCNCGNIFHLEFGNILLNLNKSEYVEFKEYVNEIDVDYYLKLNEKAQNKRKLLLKIGFRGVYFAISKYEFIELKELLTYDDTKAKRINSLSFLINEITSLN